MCGFGKKVIQSTHTAVQPLIELRGINYGPVRTQSRWMKLSTSLPTMKSRGRIKIWAKRLFALTMTICALVSVWGQLSNFWEGSLTTSLEVVDKEYLPLPLIVLCSSERYKHDVLNEMDLPTNFLDDHHKSDLLGKFPDLNETWLRATWSQEDVDLYFPDKSGNICEGNMPICSEYKYFQA